MAESAQTVSDGPSSTQERAQDSKYLSSRRDITQCLKQLRDQRIDLTLRLQSNGDIFTCKVLDVTDNDFLIEDISPRTGIQALRNARGFAISARSQGIFAYIESTKVLKWDQERGVPFFHVALPGQMLFQQRRRAARFQLPLRVSAAGASISLFNKLEMVGRIIDISVGGCRAEFDLPLLLPVSNDLHFESCAITVPRLLEIHSEVIIRHHHENRHSNRLVCGMELTRMHVTDRRRLEQFIQNIARSADMV